MKLYYDLHIHSALSPCGDADMTPNNIVNMAQLNELDVIAVADHNTVGNVGAVQAVGERQGLLVIPAMELETEEEIHVLCLFESLDKAEQFEKEVVAPNLPPIKNREDIFGEQQFINDMDEVIGKEERYLINATSVSIDQLPSLITPFGGVAIPAHVDKGTKSLSSVFGVIDASLPFACMELSKNVREEFFARQKWMDQTTLFIHDSDAHYLEDIAEAGGKNVMEVAEKNAKSVLDFLRNHKKKKRQ